MYSFFYIKMSPILPHQEKIHADQPGVSN